jgi:hypothetical protein
MLQQKDVDGVAGDYYDKSQRKKRTRTRRRMTVP